jgi:hypothetical protein
MSIYRVYVNHGSIGNPKEIFTRHKSLREAVEEINSYEGYELTPRIEVELTRPLNEEEERQVSQIRTCIWLADVKA